jgi:hypothetical protein
MSKLKNAARKNLDAAANKPAADKAPNGEPEIDPVASWPKLDPAALHGLIGEIVKAIAPTTEADPVAIAGQTLVGFGSVVGPGPHYLVEDSKHHINEFLAVIGDSAKSRKGTSWRRVRPLLEYCDVEWGTKRVLNGLSSGQGLIDAVSDAGSSDRRLMAVENEFSTILKQTQNDGNTLSSVLRQAWDHDDLRTMNRKANSLVATGAHISLITHSTRDELLRLLDSTERVNGFANRILFVLARRSQLLPEGGVLAPHVAEELKWKLKSACDFARKVGVMRRDKAAAALWEKIYAELSEARPGMVGSLAARAEAHTLRLSCIYALLDHSSIIKPQHLLAAAAFWRYCDSSVAIIFGDSRELRDRARFIFQHKDWLGRVKVPDFQRSNTRRWLSSEAAHSALKQLVDAGYGHFEQQGKTIWFVHHQCQVAAASPGSPAETSEEVPTDPPSPETASPAPHAETSEGADGLGDDKDTAPEVAQPHAEIDEAAVREDITERMETIFEIGHEIVAEKKKPPLHVLTAKLAEVAAEHFAMDIPVAQLDIPVDVRNRLMRGKVTRVCHVFALAAPEMPTAEMLHDRFGDFTKTECHRVICALIDVIRADAPRCRRCQRNIGLDAKEGRARHCFECQARADTPTIPFTPPANQPSDEPAKRGRKKKIG